MNKIIRNPVDMTIIVINIYIIVRENKNEFIDQNKELCPDYYDTHMYRYFHMTAFVCLYWPYRQEKLSEKLTSTGIL